MTRSSLSYHRPTLRVPRLGLGTSAIASAFVLGVAILIGGTTAAASDPAEAPSPVSLSNQHVGMSAEQVDAANSPAEVAAAPVPAPAGDVTALETKAQALAAIAAERKKQALELSRRAEDAQHALEAAEAGLIPGVGSNEQGPATYESCVEATIRRGESYADSDRLCRTIYPEAGN